jgi:predicted kinase
MPGHATYDCAVATLVLLNGAPASGKSTLATRLVETRPLALNLDIDVVRGLLGAWIERPGDAGIAARALAISMARTHLVSGYDVFVPQFLARVGFIEELEQLAADCDVRFAEVALMLDRGPAVQAFDERSRTPQTQAHVDASALVERAGAEDAVSAMYDAFTQMLERRPNALRIPVEVGDIDGTLARIERALFTDASA